jgi:hypothetical protein
VKGAYDLDAARWAREGPPSAFRPEDALRAALRAIEGGELAPRHVIVSIAYDAVGGRGGTHVLQSGSYDLHGQLGLVARTAQLLGE